MSLRVVFSMVGASCASAPAQHGALSASDASLLDCPRRCDCGDDAAALRVEFDYLEFECLIQLGLSTVFLNEMAGRETFYTVCERAITAPRSITSAIVPSWMLPTANVSPKAFPRITLYLLVPEAETTVFLVDLEDYDFDLSTYLGNLAWVLIFLVQERSLMWMSHQCLQ